MVRYTDMDETMRKEVMEVCTSACEKHTANNEMVSSKHKVQNSVSPFRFQ